MKSVKINDIAKELGLSRNTVSKVLNGKHVPEKTKKLVLEKANELNYKQMAGDSSAKFNILMLSAKPLTNINFFIPILRTIENICFEKGHQLFQYVCSDRIDSEAFLKEYVKSLNINGIICIETFSAPFAEMIINLGVPVVFLDGPTYMNIESKNFDMVMQDNYKTISTIVRKLYSRGIESFGFVGDINHCLSFMERYQAMLIGVGLCKIKHDFDCDFLHEDNSEFYRNIDYMVKEIKRKRNLAKAYICANDYVARTFVNALTSMGIRCPEDIKIVGFDNSAEARNRKPTLTTINVGAEEIGKALFDALISKIRSFRTSRIKIIVSANIVERESTNFD